MQDKRWIGSTSIVCVHGAGAGGWEWSVWARALSVRGFDVLAPDLMPVADGLAATRLADYRAQVVAWGRRVRSPILLGASLGGLLALAAAHEIEAAALVLVNPLPSREFSDAVAPARPAIVPWASERSLETTRRALPDADDAARLYAFRRWRDEAGSVLDEAGASAMPLVPACPVLVLASELDEDVPIAASRALARHLGADFTVLAGAGHVDPLLGRIAANTAERVGNWLLARRAPADLTVS